MSTEELSTLVERLGMSANTTNRDELLSKILTCAVKIG